MESNSQFSVVLVDDSEPFVRALRLSLLLSFPTADIRTFGSAEDALDHIVRERPHLLVTDYDMPGMNGVELAVAVRNAFGDQYPRMLVATGHPLAAPDLANFDGYFGKPFQVTELRDAILRLFAGARPSSPPSFERR